MTQALSALFLHGVGSSSDTWWRVREDLTDLGCETSALDLAGHGDRPVPAAGLRAVSDLADDVWDQVADQRFDVLAREVAEANPRFSLLDARGVARNAARFDDTVAVWLRHQDWDLPGLVVDCPVPVDLVVAVGPESTMVEPGRGRVLAGSSRAGSSRSAAVTGCTGTGRPCSCGRCCT